MMSLEEAKDRICQLEDAVERLEFVRKNLTRNASEVCGEIRCSISRSIECLRNRELALLSEVARVRGTKEETLGLQQGRLNQAINILRRAITLIQDDAASEKHVADTLVRLNQLDMIPEETPYISFHSDLLQIRETLSSFGRVDANGLPHAMVFEDPGKPSASLPRHVEEYEDADHHIFYKTLQDIQMKPTAATSIKVNIPKLSQRVEDWLHQKPVSDPFLNKDCWTKQDQDALAAARISRPSTLADTRPASTSALSQLAEQPISPQKPRSQIPSPDSSCSLNNWLALIKNHADLEEEHDFEIFDNSRQKLNTNSTKEMSQIQPVSPDLQKWLCPNSAPGVPVPVDLFGHIVKDSRTWLRNICEQLASVEDIKLRDPFQHISKEPSSWLRSRAHNRLCYPTDSSGSTKDFFTHISNDLNMWLAPQGSTSCEEKSSKSEQLVTPSSCLSPPPTDKWLLKSEGRSASISRVVCNPKPLAAVIKAQNNPVKSSSKMWLQSPDEPVSSSSNLSVTGKAVKSSQQLSTWDSTWLLKCLDPCYTREDKPPCYNRDNKRVCDIEDIDVWLVKAPQKQEPAHISEESKADEGIWMGNKSPQQEQSRDKVSNSSSDSATGQDMSDWLFVPANNKLLISCGSSTGVGSEDIDKVSCSDSWSICSTPHSLSSDQHVKDVAIATDYLNKWLI